MTKKKNSSPVLRQLTILLISLAVSILGIFVYSHFNMSTEDADASTTDTYARELTNSIMQECVHDAWEAWAKGGEHWTNRPSDQVAIARIAIELFRARTRNTFIPDNHDLRRLDNGSH